MEIEKLIERIEALERKVEELESIAQANKTSMPPVIVHAQEAVQEVLSLYLGVPTMEGIFEEVSEMEQVGKSIYLLHTKDNRNGTFSILNTPEAIATANISVSQFVQPACKIMGSTRTMPKHIPTVQEGKVIKEDRGWKIVKKAVVAFEN